MIFCCCVFTLINKKQLKDWAIDQKIRWDYKSCPTKCTSLCAVARIESSRVWFPFKIYFRMYSMNVKCALFFNIFNIQKRYFQTKTKACSYSRYYYWNLNVEQKIKITWYSKNQTSLAVAFSWIITYCSYLEYSLNKKLVKNLIPVSFFFSQILICSLDN